MDRPGSEAIYALAVVVAQIDGLSGTGKSTLRDELSGRGFCAVDSDAEFAYFGDPATGRPTEIKLRANWIWDLDRIRAFCRQPREAPVFICGGAMNQDQCAELFTHRFLLRIDNATMRHRLLARTTNDYGKAAAELAEQLDLNRRTQWSAKIGWIAVDATRPVAEVADRVIELAGLR